MSTILDKFKLEGKVAMVTGTSRGLGQPEDLKGVVVFLASEASSYMQGYTVAVDGGWLAR